MKAPFIYCGGKSMIASVVWSRLGNVPNYVEPFMGSLAVTLARPHAPGIETLNDADGLLCNVWRALKADPDAVAEWAADPIHECDLHARHSHLVKQKDGLTARLEGDPDYYDAKLAGWWLWGINLWIGTGWCRGEGPWHQVDGLFVNTGERGGNKRQLPHLGHAGKGVHRKRPHLGDAGKKEHLAAYFAGFQRRLANARVCCGDWQRVCGPTPTIKQGLTGVFLDPPYGHAERDDGIYGTETDCAPAVRDWAITRGDDPLMRIVLCGYDTEHDAFIPPTWERVPWKAHGGYGRQGEGRGRDNARREMLWCSPHCLKPTLDLFSEEGDDD